MGTYLKIISTNPVSSYPATTIGMRVLRVPEIQIRGLLPHIELRDRGFGRRARCPEGRSGKRWGVDRRDKMEEDGMSGEYVIVAGGKVVEHCCGSLQEGLDCRPVPE